MVKLQKVLKDPSFDKFAKQAYLSKDGYSVRINPHNGEREMFVAGTKHFSDFLWDIADVPLYGADKLLNKAEDMALAALHDFTGLPVSKHPVDIRAFEYIDRPRHKKQQFLADKAQELGIHTIYGHSRGGAMVADMDVDDVNKVGLDSAMIIAHNPTLVNYNEGGGLNPLGLFDDVIGLTGENNIHADYSPLKPHQVWK